MSISELSLYEKTYRIKGVRSKCYNKLRMQAKLLIFYIIAVKIKDYLILKLINIIVDHVNEQIKGFSV